MAAEERRGAKRKRAFLRIGGKTACLYFGGALSSREGKTPRREGEEGAGGELGFGAHVERPAGMRGSEQTISGAGGKAGRGPTEAGGLLRGQTVGFQWLLFS